MELAAFSFSAMRFVVVNSEAAGVSSDARLAIVLASQPASQPLFLNTVASTEVRTLTVSWAACLKSY
jgi:hypothetical protein